ncbi:MULTISPECIES: hypothetical protein [Streptomycetaceae]|uniref:hypothetical protein n=1 Tax=Streptomycetaceae TaxID=2062 RepID=UPI00093E06EF|nr:hypothetical protein [Streptomyces sp. CB02056]OKI10465.1 hypothetical protein AMK13_04900 [Streptomyces sp. CB02056]
MFEASDAWLTHPVQIRGSLAAEIADLYREIRIGVEQVDWLIRHLAEDAGNRHNNGTLFDQHCQNQTRAGPRL